METLRFLGWKPDLAVVEILSNRDGEGDSLVPDPTGSGRVVVARVITPEDTFRVPRASADLAISSGNLVGWERQYQALNHLKAVHGALRPGGILGVIEPRAHDGHSFRQMMATGAVTEEHVIALAEVAGFRYSGRSEANAGGARPRMTLKFVRP